MMDAMLTYFRGERALGIAAVVFGVALLAACVALWRTQSGGFRTGLVVPLVVFGLAAVGVGAGLVLRTDRQVRDLGAQLEADPAAYRGQELLRMERVNANWPRVKLTWAAISVASLATLLLVHRDWAQGLALALLFCMAWLMAVDVFAARRAAIYTAHIEALGATDPR